MPGEQVLKRRLIQAFLLAAAAMAAFSAISTTAQAAEECRISPGPAAPSGSRWLYRINRADHRRCWFLSSKGPSVHYQLSRRQRHSANAADATPQEQERDSGVQAASRSTSPDVAIAIEPSAVSQVASPSAGQSSQGLVPRRIPTLAYRLPQPNTPTVQERKVDTPSARTGKPIGAGRSNVILLAGVAAAGLFFAGGVFHFARRVQPRSRVRVVAGGQGFAGQATSGTPEYPPLTTSPAEDLEQSLRALTRNLQRASKMRDWHPSHADDSSPAISLPPAAAWLNRVRAEPTIEPTNHQFCGV